VSHLLSRKSRREQRPFDCGEIVAGRDNKHLDFRVPVLKTADGEKMSVVISTFSARHRSVSPERCQVADVERRCGKTAMNFPMFRRPPPLAPARMTVSVQKVPGTVRNMADT
jgi:hypothetical protein